MQSRVGIGMVFQHFMLADNLTVWENIVLGAEPGTGRPHRRQRRSWTVSAPSRRRTVWRSIPIAFVSELGVGERQRVEILKVLYRGARIIILDEPTAVLVPQEVDELFESLRDLTATGRHDRVHLAQARRGAGHRRRHHRDPGRQDGRHGASPQMSRPKSWPK